MKIECHAGENGRQHRVSLDVMDMVVIEIDNVPALRSGMELVSGLIVKKVGWGGVADLTGVAPGDIISEVNGTPVRTLHDLKVILEAQTGQEPFRFLFRCVGTWRYLTLPREVTHPAGYPYIGSQLDQLSV